jgi:hypothetical protein
MRILCILLSMCKATKQWFLRLLVIILAFNTFQAGYAVDLDKDSPENSCQHFQLHASVANELDNNNLCNSEHKVHCFNHLGCTSSLNGNSMLSGTSYLEPARVTIKLGYKKNDSALVTIYPKLLERPPIV